VRDFWAGARNLILGVWQLVDWLSHDPERPVWHRVLYGVAVVVLTIAFIALLVVAVIVGA